MSGRLLLHDVEVDGRRSDVEVDGSTVTAVRPTGAVPVDVPADVSVVEGAGGALIPGLHDHHLHLLAMASAADSVDCSPAAVGDLAGLTAALRGAPDAGRHGDWIRATGYHESVAGDLDRTVLDRIEADRPVRVQHRTGALWMLNSAALARVADVLDDSPDVERDAAGRPTGRLWRYDTRLRPALPRKTPDLTAIGRRLAGFGLTGVTEATPALDPGTMELLGRAATTGQLPQHLTLLGAPLHGPLHDPLPPGVSAGPWKLHLHDHDLPDYDELAARVAAAHDAGRAVAVHAVTRLSLLLTLAVFADVGVLPGDRVEHASVAPPETIAELRCLGIRVVTQPGFLSSRGEEYLRDVDADDLPFLYPYASLLAAGVRTCASSDAPYGVDDPWQVIASATARRTLGGHVIGPGERVDAATALAGYLSAPDDPGGVPRRVAPGAAADLVLLDAPLTVVLETPDASRVRAVWIAGRQVS
jgi:predicted amidohydrolase YtcJ